VEGPEDVVRDTASQPPCLASGTGSSEGLDSSSCTGTGDNTSNLTNTLPRLHHYSVTNKVEGIKEKFTSTATATTSHRCSQYRPVSVILKEGKEDIQKGPSPSSSFILNPYRSTKYMSGSGVTRGYGGLSVNGNLSLGNASGGGVLGGETTGTRTTSITREETRRLSV